MITPEKARVLELFQKGRNHYSLMQFEQALARFKEALTIDPEDGPSRVFALRCKYYIANPPPEDCDGVFVMKTK